MKNRPILPQTFRYKLAQFLLRVLYGRPWHYISPWMRAGVGVAVVVTYEGKVLLGRRAPHMERPNLWCWPGGFMDLDKKETFSQTAARELWEETGLSLPAERLREGGVREMSMIYDLPMNEEEKMDAVEVVMGVEVTAAEAGCIQDSDEMTGWAWFSPTELQALPDDELAGRARVKGILLDVLGGTAGVLAEGDMPKEAPQA